MAADEEDELFRFSMSKRILLHDTNPENDIYYESLLNDAAETSYDDIITERGKHRSPRHRAAPGGLAEELISGRIRKRSVMVDETDSDKDIVDESQLNMSKNDSSSFLLLLDSPSSPQSVSTDLAAKRLIDSIDSKLYSLTSKSREYYDTNDSDEVDSFDMNFSDDYNDIDNIRVRCKGNVHTFSLSKNDPLSVIFGKLSNLYGDDNTILLQFKSKNISPSDTLNSLSLSTVDILDSFILDKSEVIDHGNKDMEHDKISIKIQTSKQSATYIIAIDDILEKIMKEFAVQVNVAMNRIKFTLDGEIIRGHSSPRDLDMENDDVIDAVF